MHISTNIWWCIPFDRLDLMKYLSIWCIYALMKQNQSMKVRLFVHFGLTRRSCAMCAVLRQIQRWKQLQRRDTRPLSVFRGQRKMKNRPSYSRLLLYKIPSAFALWCCEDHLDRGRERKRDSLGNFFSRLDIFSLCEISSSYNLYHFN